MRRVLFGLERRGRPFRTRAALVVVGAALAVAAFRTFGSWVVAGVLGAVLVLGALAWLVRRGSRPLIGDWRDAERLAAGWLRSSGCRRVELTSAGADGGIDVLTAEWAVQVKHRSAPTGRPAVQQIIGAALAVDRRPAIVSTSGFTAPAIDFADDHDVALVELDSKARGRRVNASARDIGRRRRARFAL